MAVTKKEGVTAVANAVALAAAKVAAALALGDESSEGCSLGRVISIGCQSGTL
jgi:hypothetical protein